MSDPSSAAKAASILSSLSSATAPLASLPGVGGIVGGAVSGLLALGATIAQASGGTPVPHITRVRDQWPVVQAALAKAEAEKTRLRGQAPRPS